ncbi:MAG TPA: glycosyltransferase [Rhodothermales bacterium]|nr:glycosyltransferase [Rhodothermales bacterium]
MKRVLFLTYYFPPSGGSGVQRALKFAKYLPLYGWEPIVLTVSPKYASYPDLDQTMWRDVPEQLQVERTPAWDPYALYARLLRKPKEETVGVSFVGESQMNWKQKLARWLRANVFLPDARVGWMPFAIRKGRALLAKEPFDAVVSTGPPHSVHLAGRSLSRRFNIPWLADFRDPWTGSDFYDLLPLTPIARKLDQSLELRVLRDAAVVVAVSPSRVHALSRIFHREYEVVWNGFDPDDFQSTSPVTTNAFEVTYAGNLNDARNPVALWRALQKMDAIHCFPQLRIRLIGHIDPAILESAREHGVERLVETSAYLPHDEVIGEMQRSVLLLLVINRVSGSEGIIPGKIYEYIASRRPVLGLGPVQGDAAAVLEEARSGKMFDWEDADGVAAMVEHHYTAWASGEPLSGADPGDLDRFSRKEQTHRLADLLTGISSPQQHAPGAKERS